MEMPKRVEDITAPIERVEDFAAPIERVEDITALKKREEDISGPIEHKKFSQTPENTPRTPKRKLRFSPNMEIGLEKKLECLSVEQWSSPTLRKRMTCGEEGMEVVMGVEEFRPILVGSTALSTSRGDGDNLRRVVLGKRRATGGTGVVERATTALRAAAMTPPKPLQIKGKVSGNRRGRKPKLKKVDSKQQRVDSMFKKLEKGKGDADVSAVLSTATGESVTSGQGRNDASSQVDDGVL